MILNFLLSFFFILAGVDIIETNTYQASIVGFKKYLDISEEDGYNLIRKAVQLAREAVTQCEKLGRFFLNKATDL